MAKAAHRTWALLRACLKVAALPLAALAGDAAAAAEPLQGRTLGISTRQCTSEGGDLLQRPLEGEWLCARFISAFNNAMDAAGMGPASVTGLDFSLRFTRNGVGRAEVRLPGEEALWFDASIAVSDRPLARTDVDRLAELVASQLVERLS